MHADFSVSGERVALDVRRSQLQPGGGGLMKLSIMLTSLLTIEGCQCLTRTQTLVSILWKVLRRLL